MHQKLRNSIFKLTCKFDNLKKVKKIKLIISILSVITLKINVTFRLCLTGDLQILKKRKKKYVMKDKVESDVIKKLRSGAFVYAAL